MNRCRANLMFLFFGLLSASSVIADDTKRALDEIAGFAERVCQTAPLSSDSNQLELSGQANADLRGLVAKVAGLGISGAAKYRNEQSEGVLQKDLAPLLSKSVDCKERISYKLIDKLIAPTPIPARGRTAEHDPDAIYQRGIAVGHVTGAEPRLNESTVYFSEIKDTQNLDRSRDFQYRKWILHLAGHAHGSGISFSSQGPELAVLEDSLCKIVGVATDPNAP
jgi:hypothetical protein